MDTTTIYSIVQHCRGDAERLYTELMALLPPESVQKLVAGWPTCKVCVQLLDVARKDFGGSPAQQHEVCCAMDALLNWPTLRLAAKEAKAHTQTPAFKDVLATVFGPVVKVAGDGNCFYRAVVKALFAPVSLPGQLETKLAAFLREQINPPDETAELGSVAPGTIVKGVNDAATMAKDGTWADATQVYKAVEFLQRPVVVFTCTDTLLRFCTERGTVEPSEQYVFLPRSTGCVGSGAALRLVGTPLYLHFDPYGHYEAIVPAPVWAQHGPCSDVEHVLTETERLALVRPPSDAFVENACWAYIALLTALENATQLRRDCKQGDYELRQVVYSDVAVILRGILEGIRRLKNALCLVSPPDLRAAVPNAFQLHMTLVTDMLLDDIIFEDGSDKPLQRGTGCLSTLYSRVEDALKEKPGTVIDKAKDAVRSAIHPASAYQYPAYATDGRMYSPQELPSLVPVTHLSPPPPPYPEQPVQVPVYQSSVSTALPQNSLISDPHTAPYSWEPVVFGNIIQFTQARVDGDALYSLALFLQSSRVRFVEFNYCTFTDDPKTRYGLSQMASLCPHISVTMNQCTGVPSCDQ